MKKMLWMAVLAFMSMTVMAQEEPICDTPEVMPEYAGGTEAMMQFMIKNMQYPKDAEKQKIEGRVKVQFTIEKDGTVSDRKIVKSASPSLDAEAMRVAKLMTSKWKPAMDKGKNVRTRFIVPFAFKLK